MTRKKCYDLAEQLGLDIVSVTSASNGYPQNVQLALIGFDTFEQAEDVANANGLTIVSLYKRDGWNLWAEQGAAWGQSSSAPKIMAAIICRLTRHGIRTTLPMTCAG